MATRLIQGALLPFKWAFDRLFGYDFFISYTWGDKDQVGRNYALGLKNRPTDLDYTCFLDSTDYQKGEDWKGAGQVALRRTRKLILVATPAVFESEPVLREVRLFRKSERDIIPIDVGDTLANADSETALMRLIPKKVLHAKDDDAMRTAVPSEDVIDDLRNTFRLMRQKTL